MVTARRLLIIQASAALFVGALIALQGRVNGQLAIELGNSVEAAFISFVVGLVILSLVLLAHAPARLGLRNAWLALRDGQLRWWEMIGGFLGGAFVAVQSAVVPRLGVATFAVAVVAGQVTNSLAVDRLGLGPSGKQAITWQRLAAALLTLAAVSVSAIDQGNSGAPTALWPLVAAVSGGFVLALQQALNGRVGQVSRSPWSAAWINFVLGSAFLGLVLGVAWRSAVAPASAPPASPVWLYVGGALGVLFIAAGAWIVQGIGVLLFALFAITGQLIGALILDAAMPIDGFAFRWSLVVGVMVAIGGLVIGVSSTWRTGKARARH